MNPKKLKKNHANGNGFNENNGMPTETNMALSAENQNSEAIVFTLSENQKQAIGKAREQIKQGL